MRLCGLPFSTTNRPLSFSSNAKASRSLGCSQLEIMLCVTASSPNSSLILRASLKIANSWRVWSLYVMNGLYSGR